MDMGKLFFYAILILALLVCFFAYDRKAEIEHAQAVHARAVAAYAAKAKATEIEVADRKIAKREAADEKAKRFAQAYDTWKATQYRELIVSDLKLAYAMDRVWNEQSCRAMESLGMYVGKPSVSEPDKLGYLQCQELEDRLKSQGLWYDAK